MTSLLNWLPSAYASYMIPIADYPREFAVQEEHAFSITKLNVNDESRDAHIKKDPLIDHFSLFSMAKLKRYGLYRVDGEMQKRFHRAEA